jgi:hypothetical protein
MWIESHTELNQHPKVIRLCDKLKKSLPEILGHLHLLWWWTATYRITGYLTNITNYEIASASGWKEDPDLFVNALISERWIDRKRKGLYVHDWHIYCGNLIKKRLQRMDAERQTINSVQTPTNKHTKQTTPTEPNQPNKTIELLREIGFTLAGAVAITSNRQDELVRKAIEMSKGKRNRPGFITEALKKGWV